jgi:hypothetical protein
MNLGPQPPREHMMLLSAGRLTALVSLDVEASRCCRAARGRWHTVASDVNVSADCPGLDSPSLV